MENEHVLGGLVRRRSELAGEADALRERLARIVTDIGHLDATIRLFAPDFDLGTIRPKHRRTGKVAGPGEVIRAALAVLRRAEEPLTAPEIARRMAAENGAASGTEADDRKGTPAPRVARALRHQARSGVVRSSPGPGNFVLWEIAR